MPIVAVFEFPDETVDTYEKVFEAGGTPISEQAQRLSHACYRTSGGFTVVDVWADEASFASFGEVIGPAMAQAGLDGTPQVHECQGFMLADGVRNP